MNPQPYFVLDGRKRTDGRFRIYLRQNLKPATMIPTDFFVKAKSDFKKGYPKDPVLKNSCLELIKRIEAAEMRLGGASTLRECWDLIKTKPSKSQLVVDNVSVPYRYQIKEFNAKWKVTELDNDHLTAYFQHLKLSLTDRTIGNHIAELKRVGKRVKNYFEVPNELFEFRPKLRQSLPREPLNWIELKRLRSLPTEPALDMFLFECFTGIRYSDITEELKIGSTYILLRQKKTGKITAPALNPIAKEIVIRNSTKNIETGELIFHPHRRAIQTVNRRLKAIAKKHGIKKNLSTHIGRHSYARLLSDLGIPEYIRAIQLGHSPITNTQIYGRSNDYEFASQFVLAAFNRAMASNAKTHEEWFMDVNPTLKEACSKAG